MTPHLGRSVLVALAIPVAAFLIATSAAVLAEMEAPSWATTLYMVALVAPLAFGAWRLLQGRAYDAPSFYADRMKRWGR